MAMENHLRSSPDRVRYLRRDSSSYILDSPDADDSETSTSPQSHSSSRGSPEFDATQHFLSKASTTISNLNSSKKRYPRSAIVPAKPRLPRHKRAEMTSRLSQRSHPLRSRTSMETSLVGQSPSPLVDETRTPIQQGLLTPINSHYTMGLSPSLGANEHLSPLPYRPLTPPEIPYGPVYPVLSGVDSENCGSRGLEAGRRNPGQSSESDLSPWDLLKAMSDSFSLESDSHSSHRVPLVIPLTKVSHNKTEEIDAWLNELSASVRDDFPSLKVQQAHRSAGKDVHFNTPLKQHFTLSSRGPKRISPKDSRVPVPEVSLSSNKENANPAVLTIFPPTSRHSPIPRLAISSPISPLRFSKNPGPFEDFPQILPLRPSPKCFPEHVGRNTRVISSIPSPIRKKPRIGQNSPTKTVPKLQLPIYVDQTRAQAEALSPRVGQQFEGQGSRTGGRASSCQRGENILNRLSRIKDESKVEREGDILVTPGEVKGET